MPRNKGDLKKTGHIANPTGGPRFFRMEKNAVVFCSPCCLFEAAWLVIQQISIYIFVSDNPFAMGNHDIFTTNQLWALTTSEFLNHFDPKDLPRNHHKNTFP